MNYTKKTGNNILPEKHKQGALLCSKELAKKSIYDMRANDVNEDQSRGDLIGYSANVILQAGMWGPQKT